VGVGAGAGAGVGVCKAGCVHHKHLCGAN